VSPSRRCEPGSRSRRSWASPSRTDRPSANGGRPVGRPAGQ
jgi:hypothetical protein